MSEPEESAAPLRITSAETGETRALEIAGRLTVFEVTEAEDRLAALPADRDIAADLSGLTRFDTAGAWLIARLRQRIEAAGQSFRIAAAPADFEALIARVSGLAAPAEPAAPAPRRGPLDRLADLGEGVYRAGQGAGVFLGVFGLFLARLGRALRHPGEFRLTALVSHCEDVGLRAVPIVSLLSFLIGVVLAFQGATQLRQFGAEVFVVDLISISILRELGILLTSIIVAGRTASAFTAAIGSMKMREEIDAMRTLGIDPAMALFVPRILALILMLPILGLVANVMGLLGGGIMSLLVLDISPAMFLTRLSEGTDIANVLIGLSKAPVFAVIIGVVGCNAGMRVGSNAESLGRQTSKAVVQAIFAVIVADAIFSIFFAELGV
ncbi:MlaE family lipid ABC transporter permease subunit [Roseivivax sp. GX 12232]|uniref:ABC transporter permease n=1 Tax=Roseivivax sp. GX 12232 TaxID=2900547 RepID=UPI001E440139|nr:MlaE family lipid ABC transporter permease subunit [Roseivivax sp. GX 12232]MCE0505339.1 MlaE family lipid ABC transporter permease subunit [Roseivivax sp. GX 12232]